MITDEVMGLVWAAGFFDGEGSTVLSRKAKENVAQLSLTVPQSGSWETLEIPDTLLRFREAIGIGTIYGPYRQKRPNSLPAYHVAVYGFECVQAVIAMLWPWLSSAKRMQAEERLIAYRVEHWRRRRDGSVCVRGHRWSDGYWYINSRGTKVCRICTREDHRRALDPVRKRPYKARPSRQAERKSDST